MAQNFYKYMESQKPKPRPAGPVFENYQPSWSDWLANKAADMFGSSNAGKQGITDYMRDKINPLIPLVGQQESVRQIQGKAKAGDLQSAVMDTMLETNPAAKAIFIGPMAKSWNKAAAKEAVSMARGGKSMADIWRDTKTSFHKIGEGKAGKAGRLAPMQEVSSHGMAINPAVGWDLPLPAENRFKPLEEFIQHPVYDEYPGFGRKPVHQELGYGAGVALVDPTTKGLGGLHGFGFDPKQTKIIDPSMMEAKLLDPLSSRRPKFYPFPETVEHEFQHGVSQIEGWPSGGGAQDWSSFPLDPRGIVKGSTEDDLYKALIGQYGQERYPGPPGMEIDPKARGAFGFYESDVDEALARNAGRRIGLPPEMAAQMDPVSTYDMPFKYQMMTDEVLKRNHQLMGLLHSMGMLSE